MKQLDEYLGEFVYGGIDGIVTTFAVVAASAGANLSTSTIIILGFANLVADGFSMGVSAYLSTKSERGLYDRERSRVEKTLGDEKKERQMIQRIYKRRGFSGSLLEQITNIIHKDKAHFVDVVMREEKEMLPASKSPFMVGFFTYLSFILVGVVPLLAYLADYLGSIDNSNPFVISSILAAVAFAGVGLLKGIITTSSKSRAVSETLVLGAIAAGLAYYLGFFLERAIT